MIGKTFPFKAGQLDFLTTSGASWWQRNGSYWCKTNTLVCLCPLVSRKAYSKASRELRKSLHAILCSSHDEEMLPSSDLTAVNQVFMCSAAAVVYKLEVAFHFCHKENPDRNYHLFLLRTLIGPTIVSVAESDFFFLTRSSCLARLDKQWKAFTVKMTTYC